MPRAMANLSRLAQSAVGLHSRPPPRTPASSAVGSQEIGVIAELRFVAERQSMVVNLLPWLAALLTFVGLKLVLADVYKIPALVSRGVIVAILTAAFVTS